MKKIIGSIFLAACLWCPLSCDAADLLRVLVIPFENKIDDAKGVTLASASDLKLKGGKKSERAKKVGLELAAAAKEKKITACVFDRNGYKYHGRIKAIAEGAREGGLQF